jgi:pimeloyl-ACP methyl ester carboxylesterase
VRGRGPAVLLIAGATGDAGHFEQAADVLASEHTVITYDGRGNSRSRPGGPTTLDQQADDAAALLRHVGAAPALRERMLANGPSFFGHELAMFMSWIPSETELAGLRVPVRALAGRDNRGTYYDRAAQWLAKALGTDVVDIPGAHAPYLARPREFAAALLPLLKGELQRAI